MLARLFQFFFNQIVLNKTEAGKLTKWKIAVKINNAENGLHSVQFLLQI